MKKMPPKVHPRVNRMEYFECDVPSGDGRCSDNSCPCPEVVIPSGTGYLYIEQSLVDFRRKYPTMDAADKAMQQRQEEMRASSGVTSTVFYRPGPILVCEQGARLRNLDMEVAAKDAKYWWKTGKVPLRATPLAERTSLQSQPEQQEEREEFLDERINRLWKTAWELGSSEVDREKAVSIYTELLDMVDEESTSHDICAIFRNRALAYWGLKNYDAAEKDLTKELDIAQRRGDSLRIMECRKVTDKVQTDKRKAEIKNEGGEKAEKFRAMEEIRLNLWSTGSKADSAFESLFEDLQNDDPDIRAEASRLLSINPNAIEKLVSIYQDCIDSEPRKGVLAGRVLGRNISISAGSQEMIHDETSSIMYGIAVAFTPCVCGHCGRVNLGIPVPEGGLYIGFYGQSDDKEGVYALPVLCDYCGKEFFIAWDDDPR